MTFRRAAAASIRFLPFVTRSRALFVLALGTLPLRATAQDLATPPGKVQGAPAVTTTAERIVVESLTDLDAYAVPDSTTATRLDVPNRDVPRSVQVIPREVLEDRGVVRVSEAADNVPGVQYSYGYGGVSSGDFFIRGFQTNGSFRDGFRDFGFLTPLDVAGTERIEFLKGPASVLYGEGQPGGIVNFVSKRPLASPLYAAEVTVGSDDFYRASFDASGPLAFHDVAPSTPPPADAKDKDAAPATGSRQPLLMYRVDGAYENAGSFRDFNKSQSIFVSPSLLWNPGPLTSLTLFGDYQRYDYTFDRQLPPVKGIFRVPLSRFLGEPGDFAQTVGYRMGYDFVQHFNADWQFRSGMAAIQSEQRSKFVQGFDLDTDGRSLLRSSTARHEKSINYTFQNEVSGRFSIGPVENHVLVGVEAATYRFAYDIGFGEVGPLDIFNPVYGAKLGNIPTDPKSSYGADFLAGYAQDLITLLPNLKLTLAGRYDYVESVEHYRPTPEKTYYDRKFLPQVGLVYQPWAPVSIFGGWTRGFNPNFGLNRTGSHFEPETSEQFEGGVKIDLFNNHLSGTLAAYHIKKENVLASDPTDPNFSIVTGEQKSRGIEADLIGQPLPGWRVLFSYAYTDAFVSEDTSIPVGNRLAGVPANQFGLWTSYELQGTALKGLGAGVGSYYVDKREATLPNNGVNIPAYWRFDASVFYKWDHFKAQVNLKNLANRDYYGSQGYSLVPQPPFTVLGSLGVAF